MTQVCLGGRVSLSVLTVQQPREHSPLLPTPSPLPPQLETRGPSPPCLTREAVEAPTIWWPDQAPAMT